MKQKHFVLSSLFIEQRDDVGNDWYKNDFFSLIFQREGQEWIVDCINKLAEQIDDDLEDAELYDECSEVFWNFINKI